MYTAFLFSQLKSHGQPDTVQTIRDNETRTNTFKSPVTIVTGKQTQPRARALCILWADFNRKHARYPQVGSV
jgi:hypothetical protein